MSTGDPRPARTRQRLFDALYQLAETHDLASLSISEIARTAGVDRGSFYAQFADKEAFLDTVGDLLIAEFEEMNANFEAVEIYERDEIPVEEVPSLYRIIATHPGLYRQMLLGSGSLHTALRLQEHMERGFIRIFSQTGRDVPGDLPIEIRARFVTYGILGLVTRWLDHGNAEDVDQYTIWAWEFLAMHGLRRPNIRVRARERANIS